MTWRCTRFADAFPHFIGELEQVRLLGSKCASVQLEDRFRPVQCLAMLYGWTSHAPADLQ